MITAAGSGPKLRDAARTVANGRSDQFKGGVADALSPLGAGNRGPLGRGHQAGAARLIRGGVETEREGGTEGRAREVVRAIRDAATEQGFADAASRHHGLLAAVRARVAGPIAAGAGLATSARRDLGLIAGRKLAASTAGRFTAGRFGAAGKEIGTEAVLVAGGIARGNGRRFAAGRLRIAEERLRTIVIGPARAVAGRNERGLAAKSFQIAFERLGTGAVQITGGAARGGVAAIRHLIADVKLGAIQIRPTGAVTRGKGRRFAARRLQIAHERQGTIAVRVAIRNGAPGRGLTGVPGIIPVGIHLIRIGDSRAIVRDVGNAVAVAVRSCIGGRADERLSFAGGARECSGFSAAIGPYENTALHGSDGDGVPPGIRGHQAGRIRHAVQVSGRIALKITGGDVDRQLG
jgi:hypothetical protein